jgi:anaerobic selenocysteine-containing dehydrogenase
VAERFGFGLCVGASVYNCGMSKRVVHAACPHDCPDACGVLITVENGRATRIQGDPAHPVTRGFLCAKVAKYLDRVYSPDRVLYPMRRVGPKGPYSRLQSSVGNPPQGAREFESRTKSAGGNGRATETSHAFQRISWDEALDEIASRLRNIAEEFGPESILPYSYGGTLAALNGGSMDRRFFHRLGASQLERSICSAAGEAGLKSVTGAKLGTEPEQFRESKYIIAWGANIHGNNVHLWPFIEEARRKGAKLVVIDPYKTRTAACADWYIPIHPGTDVALALGMMHVIIGEELHDAEYVTQHTVGFEQLRERVKQYPPERVANWTGIAKEDIVKLAREYATMRPAVIRMNYGVQRSQNGGMATRAIAMLPCVTGSWKEVGGGLQLSTSDSYGLNKSALTMPELMNKALGRPARVVNMVQLGKALNELDNPPVKALFVYNSNPAAVCPNHNEVVRGLSRTDLFTVVHEQFFTDTTDYADIVLPATTFFEHKDIQTGYGHYYLQMSDQAIEPVGECRSNVELFRALSERMGFEEECFRASVDEMIDEALSSNNRWLDGIDRARLAAEGHVRLNFGATQAGATSKPAGEGARGTRTEVTPESVGKNAGATQPNRYFLPFAEGNFRTASGKAELYSEQLKREGLDPVVQFVAPSESRNGDQAGRFPLELLARKADNFLNSTFTNVPSVQAMEETGLLEISERDAGARGIENGQRVRVYNQRGDIELTARVNGSLAGVVYAKLNWAKFTPGGRNINVLTSEILSDMGNSATFYSVLVEVEQIQPIP